MREFFQEFVTLFLPDVASQLDFSQVTFPNKEMFTDFPDNVLYTFLPLNAQEDQEFEMLVANEKAEDIEDAMETYEDTLVLRGMTRGIQQGIQEGIQQGLLQGQRNAVLRQMRKRFGDLPADIVATVEAIQEEAQLDTLLDEVITVTTWKEMSFPA